ncbi:Metallo-hydrolase/oxidoreductase [Violaceomyces palustris]|uniref:Metallo-hydrolase/oxidoreductase n=1 Tax=Violaceomyces palustris TaxID=1673888 RepID=A0ACD0NYI4_9BASI|nr:Metallo-hydrolase/oxidoreductase [Violaceomyces palustris]
MSSPIERAKSISLKAITIYVSAWSIYYLAQEVLRKQELTRRKTKFPLKAPNLPSNLSSTRQEQRSGGACTRPRSKLKRSKRSERRQNSVAALGTESKDRLVAQRLQVLSKSLAEEEEEEEDRHTDSGIESSHPKEVEEGKLFGGSSSSVATRTRWRSDGRHPRNHWYGSASEHEIFNITNRFASLKILGRYTNVTPEWREQGAWEWLLWKGLYSVFYKPRIWWDGGLSKSKSDPKGKQLIEKLLPVHMLDAYKLWGQDRRVGMGGERCRARPPSAAKSSGSTFTWIGQSTCLIQLHGVNILTDPVFGDVPVESFMSPRRMRPMPCTFQELFRISRIDVILLTHNHFDHLDVDILPKVPAHVKWLVPLGLTGILVENGIQEDRITELDWWQSCELALDLPVRLAVDEEEGEGAPVKVEFRRRRLKVTATPASHWSGRNGLDTNRTLWNSYAVKCQALQEVEIVPEASLFFCGDTGYSSKLFTSIGRYLGPFDLGCFPIGSYEPEWHMSIQHMHVRESVKAAIDIGSRTNFGMHWGTWTMSDETWFQPHYDLETCLRERGLESEFFSTVGFGETVDVEVGREELEEEE